MWIWFKSLSWAARIGIIGGLLLWFVTIVGVSYHLGYTKGENLSKVEVERYQSKLSQTQTKVEVANKEVEYLTVTKYLDHVKYRDRIVYKTKEVIREVVPEQYNLSNGWVYAYNQSVLGLELDSNKASDSTASSTTDRAALEVVTSNNGVCQLNNEKLIALQQWFRDSEAAREKINSSK